MTVLRCTAKTLRAYVRDGELTYVLKGAGLKRPRRLFHPDDLAAFIARRRRTECPSTSQKAAKPTSSTSNVVAVDFASVPRPQRSAPPSRSRLPSASAPAKPSRRSATPPTPSGARPR
ncbi:helix-turn-helix domain-containing protein [Bosea sp. LjRoot9]|uniref:helix-turn-helix domain-containing protein n=1 Tax=Bosea sp. LjRoot9 TaxID=3342341 RepID=UPI003F4FED15